MKNILKAAIAITAAAMFISCASAPAEEKAGPILVELESGVVEGNIAMNQGPDNPDKDGTLEAASGDMFYMMDSGSITVEIDAPVAGDYVIKLYYALPDSYGDKENNVSVNSEDLGPMPFPATGGKWTAKWIQAPLNEGINTFSVSHNWGYTWFDYVTAEPIL